ncbi:MAG: hypothetical protein V4632_09695 [Pseudomonadota bacterium]
MKPTYLSIITTWTCALLLAPAFAFAFDSGSTGADGVFNPTVNTQLQLPPSGIFNFTSVNIPVGVSVTFKKNATNTPVVILSRGHITVAGTINVQGFSSHATGAEADGNLGNDGLPGLGGPGGFDGGRGGNAGRLPGGPGLGPGGGHSGTTIVSGAYPVGGGGAGYAAAGGNAYCGGSTCNSGGGGSVYGTSLLMPLVGGSGGGGAFGGTNYAGPGGGGGGGAILLAASGTVTVSGVVNSDGGWSGSSGTDGASGGGGSGGAIRIVAGTIAGNGRISAIGGTTGSSRNFSGGAGSVGRIRLEADTITRTASTEPAFTVGAPGLVFVAGLPTLTIESIAGVAAPANPTGNADITLPANTPNPVTVVFKTVNVPVGNTVRLTLAPAYGTQVFVTSPALTGDTTAATTSVNVSLPTGPSVLQAQTTYTIVASLGDAMRNFAGNERVERVELLASLNGKTTTNLITVSGKRHEATPEALAMLARGSALPAQGS